MKNLFFTIALLLAGGYSLVGQNFDNYEPLTSSGKIPQEIVTTSTKKYKADLKKLEDKDYKKKKKKDLKQFVLESNFVIDDLLQSGLVLFNDPVSNYLNEVAAQLTAVDNSTKKQIRVYVLRSPSVNAFATDRGTVFVTLGLLAQLENEAQLAFILAHELTHVREGHTADMYLETRDIERHSISRRSVLNKSSFDEALLAKSRYSKELESTADQKGLEHFLKTGYSTATLDRVFDVLKYAYLPFDDVKFEHNFFETAGYQFPESYWLAQVKPISGEDEKEDDSKSSHPNIAARRSAVKTQLEKAKPKDGKNFLVSEEQFNKLRETARFELPMLYLHNGQLPDAVYASYLLLQNHPNNLYLQKNVAKALYLAAKFKNDNSNEESSDKEKKAPEVEGESQQVHNLFHTLNGKEMTVLALRYAWMAHQLHPEDKELSAITDDLFTELARHSKSLDDFSATPAMAAKPDTVALVKTGAASKIDKINAQKSVIPASTEYWKGAYAEFLKEEKFQEGFKKGQEEHAKREKRKDYYATKEGQKDWAKQQKMDRKKGQRLGIPKVAIVNPFYLKLDARRDNSVQYVQTEYGQENLRELIDDVAKKSDMKVTILDVADLKENDTERFNEIRLLNDWFSEQVDYDDLSITPGLSQEKINAIASKYGTDYFLWTGVISLREKKQGAALAIAAGVLYFPILPFSIYYAAKPEYDMMFYAVLFDVRTGRRQTVKFEYFDKQDTDTLVKAHMYDVLTQIKTKEKK